jgi:hypothetical protein
MEKTIGGIVDGFRLMFDRNVVIRTGEKKIGRIVDGYIHKIYKDGAYKRIVIRMPGPKGDELKGIRVGRTMFSRMKKDGFDEGKHIGTHIIGYYDEWTNEMFELHWNTGNDGKYSEVNAGFFKTHYLW